MKNTWIPAAAAATAAFLGLCAACSSGGGSSSSWKFVSRSDGSNAGSGAVIVIRQTSLLAAVSAEGFGWHRVHGADGRGQLTVYLATGADAALLVREGETEVRSPVLERGTLRVPTPTLTTHDEGPVVFELTTEDSGFIDPGASGPGSLLVARGGNLLVLRHQLGVIVWGETRTPQRFDLPHTVTVDGGALILNQTAGRTRPLLAAPLPPLAERVQHDAGRQSLRMFGTRGELIAELPVELVQVFDGREGVFLTANLPHGVDARDPRPMVVVMVHENRHLLRIES